MSLQKHVVPIGFKGIDTSKDPKVLGAELLRLENGLVDRVGAITKRTGQTNYAASHSQPFVAAYKDRAVIVGDGSLRTDDGTAFDLGAHSQPFFSDIDLKCVATKRRAAHYYPDVVEVGGEETFVWTDHSNNSGTYTVNVQRIDVVTGLSLAPSQPFGSSVHRFYGKAVLAGSTPIIISIDATTEKLHYSVNGASSVVMDDTLPVAQDIPSSFDVIQCGDANNTLLVAYIDENDDVTYFLWRYGTGTVAHAHVTGTLECVGLWKHSAGKYAMGYVNSTHDVLVRMFDDSLGNAGTEVAIETLGANLSISVITGCENYAHLGGLPDGYMFYTVVHDSGDDAADPLVRFSSYTLSGTTITPTAGAEYIRRARIATRPWATSNDVCIVVHYRAMPNDGGDSDVSTAAQSGYFLVKYGAYVGVVGAPSGGSSVIGKALIGRAGSNLADLDTETSSACTVYSSSGSYKTCLLGWTSDQLALDEQRLNQPLSSDDVAVYSATITVGAPSALRTSEQGALFIPNSLPYVWDGKSAVEQGFLQYPEGLTIAQSDAGGSLAATSTFGYVACYECTDAAGQVCYSAPSPVSAKLLTGTNDTLTVTVPTLTLTRRYDAVIVLYRTDANGSVYYRLASTPNVSTAKNVSFVDNGATVTVAGVTSASYTGTGTSLLSTSGAPWVYTTGNVIENIQPSPHRVACIHGGRYIHADREWESTTIRYSRYIIDGEPPGWNDVMTIQVPAEGGAITALASFQDRLIVFKADRVLVVSGTGLSDAGTGQDYAPPTLLHAGFGCTNQKSVVQLPDGLAFLSARGLCLIDANFQVTADFGAPVKYHTDTLTVSSANLVPQKGYAIWTTTTGAALVYCYQWKQWSTFTNYAASDAAVAGGILYRHYSTTVSKENRSSFLDGSTPVVMKLVTGWISLQGLLGFGRLYRVMLMGQNISSHTLNLAMGYDFDPVWQTALTFSAASFAQSNYADHYGAGLSAGTYTDKAYILEADSPRQRLTAVRFMIYDSGAATAEGYSITAMAMLIGAKGGLWRGDGIAGTRGLG